MQNGRAQIRAKLPPGSSSEASFRLTTLYQPIPTVHPIRDGRQVGSRGSSITMSMQSGARPTAKPKARASIPTPPVKFRIDDQLSKRKLGAKPKRSRGFSSWLISFASRVTIFYLIYAALWTCPSRPFAFDYSAKDPRPVCRNLAHAQQQFTPLIKPYWHLAQQKAQPYTQPVIRAVTPWAVRAQKVSRPVYREANKRGRLIWKKRIDPARRRAIKDMNKRIDPYLKQANQYHKQKVQPHIDTVHRAVKPYHDIYKRDVSPYVDRAYQYSLQSSSVSYAFYMDRVHPRVVQAIKQVYSFLVNHVDPAVRRFYSLYIRPQLERLLEKVYERKAHYLGSDAIKTAQKDMKHAAHEADKHAKEAVRKAEQDAIKAQDDPSLLDRVKQAKDAVVGGSQGETDAVKVAQLDAELDAEEAKVKEQLEVWENGMTDLIGKEYKLAVDRLADLRNRRVSDLPDRFGLVNEAFVEDTVALLLHRIERGVRKIGAGTGDVGKKVDAGRKLVDKQIVRYDEAADATKAQIAAFYEELLQHERAALETSAAEVRRYAGAAKTAYDDVMRSAKFAVTMDEWAGWDVGVRKRAALFAEELAAVQSGQKRVTAASGAVDLHTEAPDVQKEINALRAWTDKLHGAARGELVAYGEAALAQLAGKGVVAKISDVTDRLAEQASRISTDAAAGMLGAVAAARGKLGLGEPAEEGYVARAKSYVAQGTGSGSSFEDYVRSVSAGAGAVASSASSAAVQASSSFASVVGATPASVAPVEAATSAVADAAAGLVSSAQSVASVATDAAAGVVSSASSAASQVSRSAVSAVGATPSPETVGDYIEAAQEAVADAVDGATSGAGVIYASASSAASVASRSVASAVGATPSPETVGDYIEVAQEAVADAVDGATSSAGVIYASASSAASVASRSVASAVGATPSPETVGDYIEVAQEAVADAVDGATSSAGVIYASASSAASVASQSVVSAVDVGTQSASSLASAASRSVASAVGASPSPETFADYVDDAQDAVAAAAEKAKHAVSSAAAQIHIEL